MTSDCGRRTRRAWGGVAATLLVLTAVVAVRPTPTAKATSGGDPYSVPVVVDTNPDPDVVETTIVADETTVDIGNGVMAHALTYNGTIPGPEFRLKPGDTVIVHFENRLDAVAGHPERNITGIHWHGIEVGNASDGSPITQNQVVPGGSFLYKFKVGAPGLFWYHPHHHSSTNQVFKGLYGPIVVTDPNDAALVAAGALPPAARTRTLVLSDTTVCKASGSNDTRTYDPALPWVGGGPLPAQPDPFPSTLCDTPLDDDGDVTGPALAAGDIPNIQTHATAGRTNEGQTVLTNGRNVGGRAGSPHQADTPSSTSIAKFPPGPLAAGAATLDVDPGTGLRFQVLNTAATRYMRLLLTDRNGARIPLVRVGGEGGLLDNAIVEGGTQGTLDMKYALGESLVPPGARVDLVVAIPPGAAGGVATLWTEDFNRTGLTFPDTPTVPVMHLNVTSAPAGSYAIAAGTPLRTFTGSPVTTLGPPTGALLDPATFSPVPKPGRPSPDIQLTRGLASLGIDGTTGTHDTRGDYTRAPRPASTRYAKLGDVLELTVTNKTSGAHHPFHLHGFSIQPISLTPDPAADAPVAVGSYTFPYRELRDNIDVPPKYILTFRVRFDDRPLMDGTTMGGGLGRWVFHCHIFFHAVNGMVSELVVVDNSQGNERPYVNADGTKVVAEPGATATMTGRVFDPEGDPVTVTASIGAVVTNGDGTWSWSRPAGRTNPTTLVYITGTDSHGHKDQIAFTLVGSRPTATTLTSSVNPSGLGEAVTFTATVTATGATPTGSVQFNDGASSLGAPVPLVGGVAVLTVSTLGLAAHSITATYPGAGGFGASTSATVSQVVNAAITCDAAHTLTGSFGSLNLGAGRWCLSSVAATGLSVTAGASVSVTSSRILGPVTSTGATLFRMCGTQVARGLRVSASTGFVLVGDAASGCARNDITGTAAMQDNLAGVDVGDDRFSGTLDVDRNRGQGPAPFNPAPFVGGNVLTGTLSCSDNAPLPTNGGRTNTAGAKVGQCRLL